MSQVDVSKPAAAKQRKMYIDIDGVLVVWDNAHNCIELSRGFGRLMRFCKLYDIKPYWLSMWALDENTLIGINCLLWPKSCATMAVPERLPYDRPNGKTTAVDFDSDFVWIEDGLGPRDLAVLAEHGVSDRFYWTNGLDPDCLLKFMEFARQKFNLPAVDDWGPAWESTWTHPRDPSTAGWTAPGKP